MNGYAATLLIAAELTYYLLIAQTGIVEYLHSDFSLLFPLPLGGISGTLAAGRLPVAKKHLLLAALAGQLLLSFFYPSFQGAALFALGLCVGFAAPLLIALMRTLPKKHIAAALIISYAAGTLLYEGTLPAERTTLAVVLTLLALLGAIGFHANGRQPKSFQAQNSHAYTHGLVIMSLWVFLDSALFETLARDIYIPIWKGGYGYEIVFFHTLGIITALYLSLGRIGIQIFILTLFATAYLLYFIQQPLLLAAVYPFVISFYNMTILFTLRTIATFKTVAVYMAVLGWAASGAGLFAALHDMLLFIPPLLLLAVIASITAQDVLSNTTFYPRSNK